jgi:hypothetical protein
MLLDARIMVLPPLLAGSKRLWDRRLRWQWMIFGPPRGTFEVEHLPMV